MDIFTIIKKRRSIRIFENRKIEKEIIEREEFEKIMKNGNGNGKK